MPEDPLFTSAKFYAIGRNVNGKLTTNPTVFAKLYMEQIDSGNMTSIKEFFQALCTLKEAVE